MQQFVQNIVKKINQYLGCIFFQNFEKLPNVLLKSFEKLLETELRAIHKNMSNTLINKGIMSISSMNQIYFYKTTNFILEREGFLHFFSSWEEFLSKSFEKLPNFFSGLKSFPSSDDAISGRIYTPVSKQYKVLCIFFRFFKQYLVGPQAPQSGEILRGKGSNKNNCHNKGSNNNIFPNQIQSEKSNKLVNKMNT